jgi:hypothetical protein
MNAMWQPIEAAPKDGTRIVAWVVHEPDEYTRAVGEPNGWAGVDLIQWNEVTEEWDGYFYAGSPTHWQPLPEPPK